MQQNILRRLLPVLLCILGTSAIRAQPVVYNGDIFLQSQAQVDSFPLNYPDVSHVVGNVLIGKFDTIPSDIADLGPLASLQLVTGSLFVLRNGKLKSLQGLNNLDSVYSTLLIQLNDSLETLAGLDSFKLCNILEVKGNDNLINADGFPSLALVGWYIQIRNNNNLISVNGFESLDSVEQLDISYNPRLKNITGFPILSRLDEFSLYENDSLLSIGAFPFVGIHYDQWNEAVEITILDCPQLQTVGQFPSLKFLAFFRIENCPRLSDFSGLAQAEAASSIELTNTGIVSFPFTNFQQIRGQLKLVNNDSLVSLQAFQSLNEVGVVNIEDNDALPNLDGLNGIPYLHQLYVLDNDALLNIDGLEGLKMTINDGVKIGRNKSLTSIDGLRNLERVDTVIPYPLGDFDIHNNASLVSIDSIFKLKSVAGTLAFYFDSALVYVSNFPFLKKCDGILIGTCTSLESINGFESLDSVAKVGTQYGLGIDIWPQSEHADLDAFHNLRYCDVKINLNGLPMDTIKGFEKLDSVYGKFRIWGLDSLRSMDNFTNLSYLRDSISIRNCPSLADCSALCDILENAYVGKGIHLSGNAFPCSDLSDVEAYCDTLTLVAEPLPAMTASIAALPNPVASQTLLLIPEGFVPPYSLSLAGANGAVVRQATFSEKEHLLSLHELPDGLYFLRVKDARTNSASAILAKQGQ